MKNPRLQHGGTLLGFVLGLVVGLAVALGVAMYVTKVPTPFSNKNQTRSAEQDAQETQKNKDWNPNEGLQPRPPASAPEAGAVSPPPEPARPVEDSSRSEVKPAVQADPLGELAKAKAGTTTPPATSAEPFSYFVQVGAYRSAAEAESQKARMALMGLDAKVSEREQAGRTVYRVRLGPFDDKAAAERLHVKLDSANIDNTIVRIQR